MDRHLNLYRYRLTNDRYTRTVDRCYVAEQFRLTVLERTIDRQQGQSDPQNATMKYKKLTVNSLLHSSIIEGPKIGFV
jgi:hypothetical protein